MSAKSATGQAARRDEVRTAGRGLLSIAGAKAYFIVASYAVYLGLPRILTRPEFGEYAQAIQFVNIFTNALIVGTVQSVSKLVSENEATAPTTLRQALRIQLLVGMCFAGLLVLGGPLLARFVFEDPDLGILWQVAAVLVGAYAVYAALIGSLNGRKRFQHQAGLDATFSTLRAVGILGGAAIGLGPLGAVSGFASAAVCILLIALVVVGTGQPGREAQPLPRWALYMAPLFFYHLFLNLVMLSDLLVLGGVLTRLPGGGAQVADDYAGLYRAAQTFAFVPYQLLLSVTFVVFPMVSEATSAGDDERARSTIRNAMRFSLLALLAVAAPISGAADGVMTLAYPSEYVQGAPALRILAFGMVTFALFVVSATVLGGSGRPLFAAAVGATALVVVVTLNVVFVLSVGIGENTLPAAALGTTLGMTVAMVAAGTTVIRKFGTWIPPASAVRSIAGAAAGFGVARLIPHATPLTALVALAGGFSSYVAVLFVLREMRGSDLEAIRRIVRRGG